MKHPLSNLTALRHISAMALAACLILPTGSQAASTTLATAPLVNSTPSPVLPNLMFVLDDSGSMDWDYMPDTVKNFAGNYGFNSNHCNGVYYDPGTPYKPPVDSNGLSYSNSLSPSYLNNTFTSAYVDGYNPGAGTVDLDTDFTGGSGSGSSGYSSYSGPAYYYTYTGTQTTSAQMNFNKTSSTFYTECNSGTASTAAGAGPIPGNSIFKLTTLASTETVELTISKPSYSATSSAQVNSITVNGINIMSANTGTQTSTSALASAIAAKINSSTGFTATNTSGSNVVTITQVGSTTAMGYTPVITAGSGNWIYSTYQFPDTDPVKLQNFANWYTYYSHRMLMMKTGVGLAFSPLDPSYRVGYMTMNNNNWNGTIGSSTADFVDLSSFDSTQKAAWYSKLYDANPGGSTPLRGALSNVGRLYAAKYAPSTIYTATITVSGSGATTVSSITVNGVELMGGNTATSTYTRRRSTSDTTSALASSIASAINSPAVSDFGATVSGSTVTITGPASALGFLPNITKSGGMYVTPTQFASTTVQANLNGIMPKDPMQYSCQQNFVILSTDGYWNGKNTYDLSNPPVNVGEQDGSSVARPQYDGASGVTTRTTNYSRTYQTASYTNCTGGQAEITTQPQTETCTTTISLGTAQPESCPSSWTNGTATTAACGVASVQSPNPSDRQVVSQTVTSSSSGGTSNTLADVAMYYYNNDLRTSALNNCTGAQGSGVDVCANNVPKTADDQNTAQHMSTFTLGLGASGDMQYSGTYASDTSGDYYAVAHGSPASSSVCTWQSSGTTCNWPTPTSGSSTTIDDLWHAAVDGGGTYFSATNPTTLASGLATALSSIASRRGSGSAGAPSKLNPTPGTDYDYKASYTTALWQGNLEARPINANLVISSGATWCAENTLQGSCPSPGIVVQTSSGSTPTYQCVTTNSTASDCVSPGLFDSNTNECKVDMPVTCVGTMPGKVAANSDTRSIYTANSSATALTPFLYANLTAGQQADFTSPYINGLSQWGTLTATQQTAAQGANLVNYLRGQYGFDTRSANYLPPVDNRLFRYRLSTMGDVLESHPYYIAAPVFTYTDPGYSTFASTNANRTGMVYVGANDGMLHAFYAKDQTTYSPSTHCVVGSGQYCGMEEAWAYVPSMVIPNMWKLADTGYATRHTNFVNGSPIVSDVCTANCDGVSGTPVWKTILVGGLNQGGRGYYALDVTDPTAPKLLWEFTASQDSDMGYSYGTPVITARADGTWVVLVTSGYDNGTDSATPMPAPATTFVPNSPAGSGQGFLYVLNAGTGQILSKIGTGVGDVANPSGLAKIAAWNDAPTSNRATYVYGGDLQGNLWRFNINDSAPATIGNGSVFKLALLEDPSGVVQPITTTPVLGKILGYRVVFVGTGQYLGKPDLSTTQVESEYAIKDDNATATLVNPRSTLVQQTLIDNGNGTRSSGSSNTVDFTTGLGWYVDFPDSGERVNVDGVLSQGTLTVPTNVPSATACSPGGYGWNNSLNYLTGTAANPNGVVSTYYSDMIVGVTVLYSNGQGSTEVSTAGGQSSFDPNQPPTGSASGFTGKRVLWRELNP